MTSAKTAGRRAIAYLRVSTAGQEARGSSLSSQRERVRRYAADKKLELVDVVAEAASGGVRDGEELSYEHRPRLLDLIERAQQGHYDVLIVSKFDRLSRDYPSLVVLERRLERHGVEIHSCDEENGDSAVAEFIRGQLALVAQLERRLILDRVGAGKASRKREGKRVHGGVPYGYRSIPAPDGKGRTLAIVDETAAIVLRIFDDARHGDTPGRIAKALNADGIPGPKGGAWNRTSVRLMIENEVYSGVMGGVKRAHEAIVPRRAWNAANAELAKRARG